MQLRVERWGLTQCTRPPRSEAMLKGCTKVQIAVLLGSLLAGGLPSAAHIVAHDDQKTSSKSKPSTSSKSGTSSKTKPGSRTTTKTSTKSGGKTASSKSAKGKKSSSRKATPQTIHLTSVF